MVKMSNSYVSPTALYNGTKQYCYLVLFGTERAGLADLSGNLKYPNGFSTVGFTFSETTKALIGTDNLLSNKETNYGNSMKKVSFSSNERFPSFGAGNNIFEYHLQSESLLDPSSILVSYYATFGDTLFTDTGLTVKKLLVGDANNDGEVTASDALAVMQYLNGNASLSGDNAISADVNRSGEVTASDALEILQYSNNTMSSFWSQGINSKEENENITSGKVYRLCCKEFEKNLKIPSSGTALLEKYDRTKNEFKYKFTYLGNGLYKITKMNDGTSALTASGSGKIEFATYNSSNAAQKWYVNTKQQDSFFLSPQSASTTFLTCSGTDKAGYGYNTEGGLWRIYGAEVKIYNYYDNSYVKRHASSGIAPEAYISDCQTKINNVLESVFDIKVINGNSPTLMESLVDQCTELDPDDLDSFCDRCPDGNCNYGELHDFSNCHHTSFYKNNDFLIDKHAANSKMKEIFALSIGHILCNNNNENIHCCGISGVAFEYKGVSGCTVRADVVGKYRNHRSLSTMLHEQSHRLGALKSTTCAADTEHDNCVMSYNKDNSLIVKYFDNAADYSKLYCSGCKQAISDYIDKNL